MQDRDRNRWIISTPIILASLCAVQLAWSEASRYRSACSSHLCNRYCAQPCKNSASTTGFTPDVLASSEFPAPSTVGELWASQYESYSSSLAPTCSRQLLHGCHVALKLRFFHYFKYPRMNYFKYPRMSNKLLAWPAGDLPQQSLQQPKLTSNQLPSRQQPSSKT